jgi:hypothetical protein
MFAQGAFRFQYRVTYVAGLVFEAPPSGH